MLNFTATKSNWFTIICVNLLNMNSSESIEPNVGSSPSTKFKALDQIKRSLNIRFYTIK